MRDGRTTPRILLGALLLLVTAAAVSGVRLSAAPDATATPRYDADGRPQGFVPASGTRPNLIVLVVDTFRADATAE